MNKIMLEFIFAIIQYANNITFLLFLQDPEKP